MVDITHKESVHAALDQVITRFGRVDVLINNAANDPKVKAGDDQTWSRFEHFPETRWAQDIQVGLTGAFLCAQAVGGRMAEQGHGAIINVASDLGLIAPDQRLYEKPGLSRDKQPVKPVSYSVIKHALIGLTRYLATYWADRQVRVNAIAPGGVRTDQPDDFVQRLSALIPMGRMARRDDYKGAIVFLASDASSYMTGTTLVIDGGRTCW
jgi:NAD(P)-dependent dehydrogenase (short-subunit alcohol dehydrogenase family)